MSPLRRASALLAISLAGCQALDQPPDGKPSARELPAPSLTLRRTLDPPAPSARPAPAASSGGAPASTCCDALRSAVVDVAIEEESALLFAALECDKMSATRAFDAAKLRALLGGIPLPPACRGAP